MNPLEIINKYYKEGTRLYNILLQHSQSVAQKALEIAEAHPEMNPDTTFIYEAAMLHDIGIFLTEAPDIDCFGEEPYICHGYLGNSLMQHEGFPKHGLVCERHTGMGLNVKYIIENNFPIPHRDMLPISIEEQIICFADKFYSKTKPEIEKPIEKVRHNISKYGQDQLDRFDHYCRIFL